MFRLKSFFLVIATALCAGFALAQDSMEASTNPNGDVILTRDGVKLAQIGFELYLPGWIKAPITATTVDTSQLRLDFGEVSYDIPYYIDLPTGEVEIVTEAAVSGADLNINIEARPSVDVATQSHFAYVNFDAGGLVGGTAQFDQTIVTIPRVISNTLYRGTASNVLLTFVDGTQLELRFSTPQELYFADTRNNVPFLSLRIGSSEAGTWPRNAVRQFAMSVGSPTPMSVVNPAKLVLASGSNWVPINHVRDVIPGSALDWTPKRVVAAGEHGWLEVNSHGEFKFEHNARPQRFYGVNLDGAYWPHPSTDVLVRRLQMMGYNTVRLHRVDRDLMRANATGPTDFDPVRLDQLHYLIAKLKDAGMYLNLDLLTSRLPLPDAVLPGSPDLRNYMAALHVSPAARADWLAFSTALLNTENPYTGLKLKEDPAIAWLTLVNENNPAGYQGALRSDVRALYDQRYQAWGGTGAWEPRTAAGARFAAALAADTYAWMSQELRAIGVKSLLTDLNGPHDQEALTLARRQMDFVDNHIYWDHPESLGEPWTFPRRGSDNGRSIIGSVGGRLENFALSRIHGKPFTVSEFNFAGPNRYRAECGVVMGALAATQQWDSAWRFQFAGGFGIGDSADLTFSLHSDPLALASDRAMVSLFLRKDLNERIRPIANDVDPASAKSDNFTGNTQGLLFERPVGTALVGDNISRNRGFWHTSRTQSQAVKVDPTRERMTVSTPLTAAVIGSAGETVITPALRVTFEKARGVVYATSLDRRSFRVASRVLVAHLTEAQNQGQTYSNDTRDVLETWGTPNHMLRDGKATITMRSRNTRRLKVYRLDLSGQRVAEMPFTLENGWLTFTADVRGPQGATIYYEIVR